MSFEPAEIEHENTIKRNRVSENYLGVFSKYLRISEIDRIVAEYMPREMYYQLYYLNDSLFLIQAEEQRPTPANLRVPDHRPPQQPIAPPPVTRPFESRPPPPQEEEEDSTLRIRNQPKKQQERLVRDCLVYHRFSVFF